MTAKDNKRLLCSLSEETIKMLNEQVALEAKSSAKYLAMASWCDTKGYQGASKFLYHHAEEEKCHMLKIFNYINNSGGHAVYSDIVGIEHNFSSFKEVFIAALTHEIKVTQSIHKLVDHCLSIKDYSTFNFLQWFVAEQVEEEFITRRAVELFDVIGIEGIGCYTIDKEIGKLKGGAAI